MTERKWTLKVVPVSERMFDDELEWEIHDEVNGEAIMSNVRYYPYVPYDLESAHLIAAAPDLYEALEEVRLLIADEGYDYQKDMVNKALAKARGETQ